MLKFLAGLALLTAGFSAAAETKTFTVEKMHCADCVATVKQKVCAITKFEKCEVTLVDEAKELGKMTLTTRGQEKIDVAKIEKIVTDEGYVLKK